MKSHTNIQIETRFTSKYFSAWWKEFSRKFRNLKSKFEEWPIQEIKLFSRRMTIILKPGMISNVQCFNFNALRMILIEQE